MNNSITCFGEELLTICADLRKRGMVIESLDAMVVRPSGWRVHYFERREADRCQHRDKASPDALVETKRVAPDVIATSEQAAQSTIGSTPIAPANLPVPAMAEPFPTSCSNAAKAHGEAQDIASSPEKVGTLAAGNSISVEDRLGALQSKLESSGKLKRSTRTKREDARVPYKDE